MAKFTLCWDCKNSTTGVCRWSRRLKPVHGWEAEPGKNDSVIVIKCPEFIRNSWGFGQYRTEEAYNKAMRRSL